MEKCLHFHKVKVNFTKEVSQMLVSKTKSCDNARWAHVQ